MTGRTNVQHCRRPAVFWLIAKKGAGQEEVLTLDLDGEESEKTLPVFCFEEEANMFLSLGSPGAEWQLRETAAGELISILLSPYTDIEFVSLDPLPEFVYKRMVGLVSLRKEPFMECLIEAVRSVESRESLLAEWTNPLLS